MPGPEGGTVKTKRQDKGSRGEFRRRTTSAARRSPRRRWWLTATSRRRRACRRTARSRRSRRRWARVCATSTAAFRSPSNSGTPRRRPRPRSARPRRASSGRCTTPCSKARRRRTRSGSSGMRRRPAWTCFGSAARCCAHAHSEKIRGVREGGVRSGVAAAPAFFINNIRHESSFGLATLLAAVQAVSGG